MTVARCPGCGETEDLSGRDVDGDIEVTCHRCGAVWSRGEPRCRTCGRPGGVTAQQRMTRHPRGTLLAVIGVHEVRVCPDCDADVAEAARGRNRPLPDGYRSRFVHGPEPEADASEPRPRAAKPRRSGSTYVGVVPSAAPAAPSGPVDPTVRQATEAFLESSADATESVVMVMLGAHLGPSTRLAALDLDAGDLATWVDRTWGSGPRRADAVATLRAAFGHWVTAGWLEDDPTADLE